MTDTERAAHSNLMLMCTPHHKEIDRLHPDEYSVELLTEWKRLNEPGGIEALRELDSVNESNLESLIVRALESRPQTRQVEVDTLDSFSRELGSTTSLPFPAMLEVRRLNPHLKALDRFVVTNIRNVGAAAVTIQSVGIKFVFELDGATGLPEFMLVGRNSFPLLNPLLPKRLLDGESTHWLTDPGMFGGVQTALRAGRIVSFHSEVHLASGELIASDPVAWSAEYFEE
jgi:hypothetical protein